MIGILEEALKLMSERRTFAVCIVVEKKGSGPAKPGDKMIVTADGSRIGTLGGWSFEKLFMDKVQACIRDGRPEIVEVDITGKERGGLECGGKLKIFVDVWKPDPRLVIFGAGHIGKALAKIAKIAGYHVTVVESERQAVPSDMDVVLVEDYGEYAREIKADGQTYIAVTVGEVEPCTAILKELLPKSFPYIGLLGSRRKIARVKEELKKHGLKADELDRIRAPIGIDIGAETPGEIAISIMAEIIKTSRGKASRNPCQ